MERLALLVLLVAGCGSSDPLVGDWSGMLTAAPAMMSQSEDWTFTADHKATRTNVIRYNDLITSVSGCVETIFFMFPTWTVAGSMITIDGGLGNLQRQECVDSANNQPAKSLGDQAITLTGTFAISGGALTMVLNNDSETYTRK